MVLLDAAVVPEGMGREMTDEFDSELVRFRCGGCGFEDYVTAGMWAGGSFGNGGAWAFGWWTKEERCPRCGIDLWPPAMEPLAGRFLVATGEERDD